MFGPKNTLPEKSRKQKMDGGGRAHSDPAETTSPTWIINGNLLSSTIRLTLPMIGAAFLHDLFSIADMFFVGRLGPSALSAVAIGSTLMGVLWIFGVGLITGCTSLVAQSIGAGDMKMANRVAGQSVLLGLAVSLLVASVTPAIPRILMAMGAEDEVLIQGISYLQIVTLGSVFVFFNVTFAAALRGAGDAVTPLKVVGGCNLLNIALDPLIIFGWGPIPAMGVAGSALATVMANLVGAVILARILFGRGHISLRLERSHLKPDLPILKRIVSIGMFGSGQMLMRNISALALVRIVAFFGVAPLAAYGVGMRLWMVVMMPGMGFGNAASTLVGQNMGAGQVRRATRAAWLATGMYTVLMVLVIVCFWYLANPIIGLFNSDPQVVATGGQFLRWLSSTLLFFPLSMVLSRAMNGAGDTLWPMILTAISMLLVRIPSAYYLASSWDSVTGVWAAIAISNLVQGLLFAAVFLTGRWQRATIVRQRPSAIRAE